jgi:glutathione gamma-glutamylcysteinyltransferase
MEGDLKHAWDTGLTMVDTPGAGTPEILLGNLFEQREVVVGRSRGKLAECDTFPFIINFYLIKGNVFQFMTIDHVATEGVFTVSDANARFAHPSISTPSRPIQGGLPVERPNDLIHYQFCEKMTVQRFPSRYLAYLYILFSSSHIHGLFMTSKPESGANMSPPSFYQRELPADTCVAFSSRQGKRIFASAMQHGGLKCFFALIQQFHTQSEPSYCGLATLVLVLNAFSVDPEQTWKGPWRWYEETMLNCCLDLEDVKTTGITLRDFRCLAHCQGLSVDLHHCDDASLDEFRISIETTCVSSSETVDFGTGDGEDLLEDVLVVSYSRKVIRQTGSGHFAVLAAFDPVSDSVLILDTARFKYGCHWVKVPLLFEAMDTVDPDTGRKRGFVVLSSVQNKTQGQSGVTLQTMSLLFRSKMTQNPVRRRYKRFLNSLAAEINWQQTMDFWRDKEEQVWSIIEPLRLPKEENMLQMVINLRGLITSLLKTEDKAYAPCWDNTSNPLCTSEMQALYVVYLASLGEERRRNLVLQVKSRASNETREQLLSEANLISSAISFSGESSV